MCIFCETIYNFDEYVSEHKDYISYDKQAKVFWLHANSGSRYTQGLLYDVKFCPYCGRKLQNNK